VHFDEMENVAKLHKSSIGLPISHREQTQQQSILTWSDQNSKSARE